MFLGVAPKYTAKGASSVDELGRYEGEFASVFVEWDRDNIHCLTLFSGD